MTSYKRFVVSLVVVLVLCALALVVILLPSRPYAAPDVIFKTISGKKIALSGLRGKPVLVNFWASTCSYCLQEMPHIANLYRELSDQGLQVIGVAMPYDMPSRVVQTVKLLELSYPVAIDPEGIVTKSFGNIRLTPTSFLINSNGMIIDKTTGRMNLDQLRHQLVTLLGEK